MLTYADVCRRMRQVLEEISEYHASESGRSWMGARYTALLAGLASGGRYAHVSQGLQVHSIELVDAVTGQLVAGEVRHSIGRAHTSLTPTSPASAYLSIRQHTLSIRQHTSAYALHRPRTHQFHSS
jgi:hypothetical protein